MSKDNEQSYGACDKPAGHGDHLCTLMERGQTEEIRRRAVNPAFICGNCEARADRAEDLCNPKSL